MCQREREKQEKEGRRRKLEGRRDSGRNGHVRAGLRGMMMEVMGMAMQLKFKGKNERGERSERRAKKRTLLNILCLFVLVYFPNINLNYKDCQAFI